MQLVKKEKEEPKYFVPEIAQAIGKSEGTIRGYFMNKSKKRPNKSTKNGLTLEEIVEVIERKRTRGDGINFNIVREIQQRLADEYGYIIEYSDEIDIRKEDK